MKNLSFLFGFWSLAAIAITILLMATVGWYGRQHRIEEDFRKSFYTEYPRNEVERQVTRPVVIARMSFAWEIVSRFATRTQKRMAVDDVLLAIVQAEDMVRHIKAPRFIRKHIKHMDIFNIEETLNQRQNVTKTMQSQLQSLAEFYQQIVRSAHETGFEEETRAMPFLIKE